MNTSKRLKAKKSDKKRELVSVRGETYDKLTSLAFHEKTSLTAILDDAVDCYDQQRKEK